MRELFIVIAIPAAIAAAIHERYRAQKMPGTQPYTWGFFVGYSAILFGAIAVVGGGMLLAEALNKPEELGAALLAVAWGVAFAASGVGILRRRKWAWITRICLWPNIITIVINIIYYRNRRSEMEAEASARKAAAVHEQPLPAGGSGSASPQTPDAQQTPAAPLTTPTASPTTTAAAGDRRGKLGIVALSTGGAAALVVLALAAVSGVMLGADPTAFAADKPQAMLLGLGVVAVAAAVIVTMVLAILSLIRREHPRWPAITSLVTAVAVGSVLAATAVVGKQQPKEGADGGPRTGTGFFVTGNGYLITCRHVIENGGKITVVTSGGTLPAEVVAVHKLLDLALLKVDAPVKYLPLSKAEDLQLGANVGALGFPNVDVQGFEPKLAKGHVAALSGAQDDPAYIQLGMAMSPGYSGSAVFDRNGNAVGVATMTLNESIAPNVSYATKGELVYLFLVDAARKMELVDLILPRPFADARDTDMEQVKDATVLVVSDAEE